MSEEAGIAGPGAALRRTASLKIKRYDPEVDPDSNWQTFQVPVEPGDRVLDKPEPKAEVDQCPSEFDAALAADDAVTALAG
jgi:hypothetical protein